MKAKTEDDMITTFISDPGFASDSNQQILGSVLSCETQEGIETIDGFDELSTATIHYSASMEIERGKALNINPELSNSQKNNSWMFFGNANKPSPGTTGYEGNSC